MKYDRSIEPSPSSEISFRMPSQSKFSLNNELDIYFVKKNDLPIIRLNVIINAGSKFDPGNKKGTSNLLTMCIDEGAGKYNALELSEQFDLLGAHSVTCGTFATVSARALRRSGLTTRRTFWKASGRGHCSRHSAVVRRCGPASSRRASARRNRRPSNDGAAPGTVAIGRLRPERERS